MDSARATLTWELLCLGTPRSVITAICAAIQQRPCQSTASVNSRPGLANGPASITGPPTPLQFPIHGSLVASLLRLRPLSLLDNRDLLLIALNSVVTIHCLQVSEVAALLI